MRDDSDGVHTLIIRKVSEKDVGTYRCDVSNTHGDDSTEARLTIIEEGPKKTSPKFEQGLSDVKATEGEDINLKVKVSGNPEPTIKWTKDGEDLKIDRKHTEIKKEKKDGSESLIVRNSTTEDTGKYTCTISNSEGSETTSSKVTVTEKTEKASFKKGLKDVEVTEGEDIIYDLKIDGTPQPKVKWAKDGSVLEADGTHVEQKLEKDGTLKLIVHESTKDDSGEYKCTISNSEGSDSTSSKVTVTEKKEKASFKKGLKDIEVTEGEDVVYNVKIAGKPKPTAKWSKDGASLSIDGKHVEQRKEEAEDSLTIVIHKCTKEDAGEYSCTITNTEGSETTTSKTTITENKEKVSFKKGLKDIKVTEGEDVVYNVKIAGKPKPTAKWSKDGASLSIDGKHVEQKREDAEDSLTIVIHKCTKEDAGEYSCTITNTEGSETTTSKMTITETTEKASFKKGLKDVQVTEGEDIVLNVEIAGTPKPEVNWTKDGADVKIDSEHVEQRKEDTDDSLTLVVHSCTEEDTGSTRVPSQMRKGLTALRAQ
ncbi:muscle M-line assembly protein unc-89-like [Uloborus diversus]|uniref:muscle M-line assembly protein unc-89-like n=1 Tax=Uloborus diversus TaxID=327109 RepID=UPI0024092A06|nr:muscle M-line assembly protein unc-89-like [Uloborus diversus]